MSNANGELDKVTLFADSSSESRRIEDELKAMHVPFVRIARSQGGPGVPALQVGAEYVSGASNILLSLDMLVGNRNGG